MKVQTSNLLPGRCKFIPSKWFQAACWSGRRAPWICLAQYQSRSPGKVTLHFAAKNGKPTIFDTSSMERCLPGMAGTPVMKSWVLKINIRTRKLLKLVLYWSSFNLNGLITTDLQHDGTRSSWDLRTIQWTKYSNYIWQCPAFFPMKNLSKWMGSSTTGIWLTASIFPALLNTWMSISRELFHFFQLTWWARWSACLIVASTSGVRKVGVTWFQIWLFVIFPDWKISNRTFGHFTDWQTSITGCSTGPPNM